MNELHVSAAILRQEALAWVIAHRERFRIGRDFINDADKHFALKAFTELLLYVDRLGALGLDAELADLRIFVETELPLFDWIGAVLHSPVSAASLGYVLSYCERFAVCPPFTPQVARRLVASRFIESLERVPFRIIEIAFAMLAGGADLDAAVNAVAERTTGAAHTLSPHTTRMGLYSVTHTIFFAAEFGRRDLAAVVSADVLASFQRFTTLGTAHALRGADLDLLSEWLMCWSVLDLPVTRVAQNGFDVLVAGRREDGSRPSFTFDPGVHATLCGEQATAYAFKHAYHTTLVAGMCGALWARTAVAA